MRGLAKMLLLAAVAANTCGCWWLVAGSAGAEAGYVAVQDDRSPGQTVSDQWIHTKVKTELLTSSVKSRNLTIAVRKGEVTLKGVVDSEAEKERAVAVARGVTGVKKVVDKIFVAR